MSVKGKTTVPNSSVSADAEQPFADKNIITDDFEKSNDYFFKMQQEMRRMLDPSYLPTTTMSEILDTVYPSKLPIIDGLLYPGTHLFVGAPKLGKSFFMAQLAYHVSTGIPLWDYCI